MEKDVLMKSLDEIFKLITESLKVGAGIAKEQLPIFLQEVVRFAIAKHIAFLIFGIIILIVGLIMMRLIQKNYENTGGAEYFILMLSSAVSIPMIFYNTFMLLQAYFAPRLYLFYTIKDLLGLGTGAR
jgi:hypothetical protein